MERGNHLCSGKWEPNPFLPRNDKISCSLEDLLLPSRLIGWTPPSGGGYSWFESRLGNTSGQIGRNGVSRLSHRLIRLWRTRAPPAEASALQHLRAGRPRTERCEGLFQFPRKLFIFQKVVRDLESEVKWLV